MKITQNKIAKALDVSQPFIHRIITGKDPVTWPLAEKLSDLFPGKSIKEWKRSGPEDIKRAFNQLAPAEKEAV